MSENLGDPRRAIAFVLVVAVLAGVAVATALIHTIDGDPTADGA